MEEDIRRQLGRTIVVGAGDSQFFLYAGTEIAAMRLSGSPRRLAQHDIEAEFALHRWHPIEEQWGSPDVAMPQTDTERQAEHERLEDAETAESWPRDRPMAGRVEFPSHREAVALARKLAGEGITVVRRWKFLIVAADNRTTPGNSPHRSGGRHRPTPWSASRNPVQWAGCSDFGGRR